MTIQWEKPLISQYTWFCFNFKFNLAVEEKILMEIRRTNLSFESVFTACDIFTFRLKKKSQSVDITAPGFNPLAGAGKQTQASKPPAPKTPIIEEEQNNTATPQKRPSRKSELKRFYTIGEQHLFHDSGWLESAFTA